MKKSFILLLLFFNSISFGCNSDYDCGYGNACVKPRDSVGYSGICVKPTDEYGNPDYSYSSTNSSPTEVNECQFDTDCDIGYSCMKRGSEIYGVCMK